MRYIDSSKLPVPAELSAVESDLLGELRLMTPQERSKAFASEKYRAWSWWAQLLRTVSYDKCWYSECRLPPDTGDVDHFRPKNAVAKQDEPGGHGGYWWLGVLVSNFRFSSENCNRLRRDEKAGMTLGKGTRFPLEPGCTRVRDEYGDITTEKPLLLDPTVEADVKLLWFDEEGRAESLNPDPDSLDARRVEASRQCYHLDEQRILTKRGAVCLEVRRLARLIAQREPAADKGDAAARRALVKHKLALLAMTRDYAEFSAAARATLKAYDYVRSVKEVLDAR
jgi:hypothetical protein